MKINFNKYDYVIVAFSGGKDSTACFLHLLELGCPISKIELWHHLVDGKDEKAFMDWECTEDYCRKFAAHFKVPIYFSWKSGGFKREMLRKNSETSPTHFEEPDLEFPGEVVVSTIGGNSGRLGTRMQFPQVSPNLSVRWCSAYLKIDVCDKSIKNQQRFIGKRTLIISGERAEESPARSKYAFFEVDRADTRDTSVKRHVDRCRLIHNWPEKDVWCIIKRHGVWVHPCYYLGYGRCSCKFCIFGNKNQFATSAKISPNQSAEIIKYEKKFKKTIKRDKSVGQLVKEGTVYVPGYAITKFKQQAIRYTYTLPIVLPKNQWVLPAGAFGENDGPQ